MVVGVCCLYVRFVVVLFPFERKETFPFRLLPTPPPPPPHPLTSILLCPAPSTQNGLALHSTPTLSNNS